jgi:acyl carrier protein
MSSEELKDKIRDMMITNLMLKVSREDLRNDLALFAPEGLGLDSIDALELVVSLEKTFGVKVPDSETAKRALASINTIHDYIIEQRGHGQPARETATP